MPNYYELLRVEPTVSDAEIQLAFDEQYDQWRRLVTHHDPNVVNQANQAIELLEKIRATLTDPVKRSAYDEAIGIKGLTAGLADPSVLLTPPTFPMTPPPPNPNVGTGAAAGVVNAWVCPKCGVANAIGTRFCKNCGTALGRDCPNCGKTIEAVARFCPECGVSVSEAMRAKQLADEEKRRAEEEERYFEQLDQNWETRAREIEAQVPAAYSQLWILRVGSPFEETMNALIRTLNRDIASFRFRTDLPQAREVIRTYDQSGANKSEPMQLYISVESKEKPQRRILIRLFGNVYFGGKTVRRFEDEFVSLLRQEIAVLDVVRM